MAKIRTYVNGDALTADRINAHLNRDVPAGATTQFSAATLAILNGPSLVAPTAAEHQSPIALRDGLTVNLRGAFKVVPANYLQTWRQFALLPAPYRPGLTLVDSNVWVDGVAATLLVNPDGSCYVSTMGAAAHPADRVAHFNSTWIVPA